MDEHNRFDKEHIKKCKRCYDELLEFEFGCEMDAVLDELARETLNNGGSEDEERQ